MAKAVFRPNELILNNEKVMISSPVSFFEVEHLSPVEEDTEIEKEDVYTGPTAEDLRREAEEFTARWNI